MQIFLKGPQGQELTHIKGPQTNKVLTRWDKRGKTMKKHDDHKPEWSMKQAADNKELS